MYKSKIKGLTVEKALKRQMKKEKQLIQDLEIQFSEYMKFTIKVKKDR